MNKFKIGQIVIGLEFGKFGDIEILIGRISIINKTIEGVFCYEIDNEHMCSTFLESEIFVTEAEVSKRVAEILSAQRTKIGLVA